MPHHLKLYSFIRIALIAVFLAYCLLCAWCFLWIELGKWHTEYRTYRFALDRHRNGTTQSICRKLKIDNCDTAVFTKAYEEYEKFILNNLYFAKADERAIPWTFRNSFGFVLAIFFTTGDSPLVPLTEMGRILSCIFPILGIPLFLTVSLFYGKLLNQMFSWIYMKIIRKDDLEDSREDSNQTISTVLHPQTLEISCKTKTSLRDLAMERDNESSFFMLSRLQNSEPRTQNKTVVKYVKQDQPSKSSDVHKKTDKKQKSHVTVNLPNEFRNRKLSHDSCALPIKIALLILYAYIGLGSIILHVKVGWDYIAAFYYLQSIFTTTGIGDMNPGDVGTLFHAIYVFFGFILAAMVLESIRVYLTENFRSGLEKVSQYLNFTILNDNIIMIPHALLQKRKKEKSSGSKTR